MYQKLQSYDVWFLRYEAWRTEFFVILHCFLPFYLPNNPKNQKFEKLKKAPGDIIILLICTINDNQVMYGSWDMKYDRQIFLSFWTIFCPFTPLTTQNIKIEKNPGDIIILHMYTINYNHMIYGSWDIKCDGENVLSFWTFFCPFSP